VSTVGDPVLPSDLPLTTDVDSTDYVLVEVDGVWKKATLETVWNAAWSANKYFSTELGDIGHPINTTNKFIGKLVFDNSNSYYVYASGGDAADTWLKVSDDTVAYTPV
jgi:hypothetical protein